MKRDRIPQKQIWTGSLAGIELVYDFRFSETEKYLRPVLNRSATEHEEADGIITVTDQEFSDWQRAGNEIDAFAEFCLSCMPTSERLLQYNRCVFHAAALRYRDRAWLITGGSGTGKSTQCRALVSKSLDEISVINGDKPILECIEDGSVWVHPSPWTGKEGLCGAQKARLAGIFLMQFGEEDRLEKLTAKQAGPLVFSCVFHSFCDSDMIKQAALVAEKITESGPVWLMTSHDIEKTTRLLDECIKTEAETDGL